MQYLRFLFLFLLIYSFTFADLSEGLAAYYPFNGNANDDSGNGHNGSVTDAVPAADRFGNPNSAYDFDGNGDYINIGDELDSNNHSLTLCAWIKAGNFNQYAKIINKGQTVNGTPPHSGYSLRIVNSEWGVTPSGQPELRFGYTDDETDAGFAAITVGNLEENRFHFIAGILNRSRARSAELMLYVDSVPVDTTIVGVDGSDTNIPLAFGALHRGTYGSTTEFFNGIIDDIRIYHRALSHNEICSLYHINDWMDNIVISIEINNNNVNLDWNTVAGAASYKVYSSNEPNTGFSEDTGGTFDGESWIAPIIDAKKFYFVKAVN